MPNHNIQIRAGCIYADARGNSARDFADTCRAVAVACLSQDIQQVLIDASHCEAQGIGALRDALTTMVRAGIAAGFRVAFVTDVREMQRLFVELERDLALLEIHAGQFENPGAAAEWLAIRAQPFKSERVVSQLRMTS
jgi:hypothetical protein